MLVGLLAMVIVTLFVFFERRLSVTVSLISVLPCEPKVCLTEAASSGSEIVTTSPPNDHSQATIEPSSSGSVERSMNSTS